MEDGDSSCSVILQSQRIEQYRDIYGHDRAGMLFHDAIASNALRS